MTVKTFFKKFFSSYVWGNLYAMVIVIILLGLCVKFGLQAYTLHGESIKVPDIVGKSYDEAKKIVDDAGLTLEVTDTGYVKTKAPDCILEQSPRGGNRIKSARHIYVTINASTAPTFVIPDIIDNSSYREARALLLSMGFKVGDPKYIPGERDWVYGLLANGRRVEVGDRVAKDAMLTLVVGDGTSEVVDSAAYFGTDYQEEDDPDATTDEDDESYDDDYDYDVIEVPIDDDEPTSAPEDEGSSEKKQEPSQAAPPSEKPKE